MEEVGCGLTVTKSTTKSTEVCPQEDAIRALLETLVDPWLPFKPSPSDALPESVAKQIHAVVLLYNYYHRREHPHLERLSFESMRPALLQHLKESSEVEGDGESEQTVLLLEKVIVDACSLSMSLESLDASSDFSSLEKWPIRKIAVLLVDSEKESCYLQHGSISQGVWSLVEKAIAAYQNEEVIFQKVAFAAIKDATGVNPQ